MGLKNVYMNDVENGKKLHMTYNQNEAKKILKTHGGIIRFMSYGLYQDGLKGCPGDIIHGWDYPTFVIQSEILNIK